MRGAFGVHAAELLRTPKLLEPRRPSARELVEAVANRVAPAVVLGIVLGGVELAGRKDLRDDLPAHHPALRELPLGALRELTLLFVVIEARAAVLAAPIAELPAGIERIDVVPEHVEQRLVLDDARVVFDLYRLEMPRPARRH